MFLSNSTFNIEPRVGDFYFFPNYLMHTVYPFSDTDEERRSISFNANMFANILTANKECEKAILKVSSDGLATISFNIDDYKSEYFLVATQQVT